MMLCVPYGVQMVYACDGLLCMVGGTAYNLEHLHTCSNAYTLHTPTHSGWCCREPLTPQAHQKGTPYNGGRVCLMGCVMVDGDGGCIVRILLDERVMLYTPAVYSIRSLHTHPHVYSHHVYSHHTPRSKQLL